MERNQPNCHRNRYCNHCGEITHQFGKLRTAKKRSKSLFTSFVCLVCNLTMKVK